MDISVNLRLPAYLSTTALLASAIIFIFAWPVFADEAQENALLNQYVESDQNHNVLRRIRTSEMAQKNLLSDEDKQTRQLSYFKISTKNPLVSLYTSNSITPEELESLTYIDEKGKEFYLVPILNKETKVFKLMKFIFGNPMATVDAKKLLGRTTHLAFKNDEFKQDFFVKWDAMGPGQDIAVKRALMVNDYIEGGNDLLPEDLRDHVIHDVAALNIKLGPVSLPILFRSTKAITNTKEGERLYPAHGLLGCDECVESIAKKMGLTGRQWKRKVFIPKLARLTAYSQLVLGATYELHTQNLLIKVNEDTGDIVKLYVRDLTDVVMDPFVRIARGNTDYEDTINVRTIPLVAHHLAPDPNVPLAKDVGFNTATYTLQSVGSHLKGFQARAKDTILFLHSYMDAYREIFGRMPTLSADSLAKIEEIKNLVDESKTSKFTMDEKNIATEETLSTEEDSDSRGKKRKQMVTSVIQEIVDQGKKELGAQLYNKLDVPSDQKDLINEFREALHRQEITFASEAARERVMPKLYKIWRTSHSFRYLGIRVPVGRIIKQLTFGQLNGQIVAIDKDTGDILATTIFKNKKIKNRELKGSGDPCEIMGDL